MVWTDFGTEIDNGIAALAERASRRMTRRQAVKTIVTGGAAAIATLTLGQRPAFATTCMCGPTVRCSGCPPVYGCPSGYTLCKGSSTNKCFNYQHYRCEYPTGYWTACTGLGKGGGYKTCFDCIKGGDCSHWCTCLSECICCGCNTPEDVKVEQRRLQEFVMSHDT